MLSCNRLKELLIYNSDTGEFIWKVSRGRRIKINDKAGYKNKNNNSVRIVIDGKNYLAHRLAWLYMTGKWPKNEIDHINNNAFDNKWNNLREATRSQNSFNRKVFSKTNSKGIHFYKNKYKAYICLGTFDTLEEARKVYEKYALMVQGEFINKSVRT